MTLGRQKSPSSPHLPPTSRILEAIIFMTAFLLPVFTVTVSGGGEFGEHLARIGLLWALACFVQLALILGWVWTLPVGLPLWFLGVSLLTWSGYVLQGHDPSSVLAAMWLYPALAYIAVAFVGARWVARFAVRGEYPSVVCRLLPNTKKPPEGNHP